MLSDDDRRMWGNVYRALVMARPEDRIAMLQQVIAQEGPAPDEFEHRIRSLLNEKSPEPFSEKRYSTTLDPDNLLTLERLKFAGAMAMPREVVEQLPADFELVRDGDIFMREAMLKMRMSIFGKRLPDEEFTQTERLYVPATTWQYWKWEHRASRWWGWVARRWPVRKKSWSITLKVDISRALVFPELTKQFPQHPVVQVAKTIEWDPREFFE